MVSGTSRPPDVVVIGDGLIGLSTAYALARRGVRCVVAGTSRPGAASPASAGLLVPSIGRLADDVRPFFLYSLGLYPAFVAGLAAYDPDLRLIEGMIERTAGRDVLHPRDGAIDNVRLLAAFRAALAAMPSVELRTTRVDSIEARRAGVVVGTESGTIEAGHVVLAAGAWAPSIGGLPRALPVSPLKGQMIAMRGAAGVASPLQRPVMGDDVYLVPRGAETLVGATVEVAGFDTTVTADAVEWLRRGALALAPELEGAEVVRSWAGIRPATPDMLPILGPDPAMPALVYACGHSKNGVLLAPGTGEAVAGWCVGEDPGAMLEPFAVSRFREIE